MSDSDTALEHLKLIRGLMERATVYQTVTFPTAIFGGLMAVVTAGSLFALDESVSTAETMSVWLAVFVIVNAFHHGLIWRTSRRENEAYLSPGLHMALKAILPPIFSGGVLGLTLGYGPAEDIVSASLAWTTFYGLALLATHGFSPRSLRVLGLAFTLTGCLLLGLHWWGLLNKLTPTLSAQQMSALSMGLTFGVFHLIYGFCVRSWQRSS